MGPVLPTPVQPKQTEAQAFAARRAQDAFESGPAKPQRQPVLQAQPFAGPQLPSQARSSGEALVQATPQNLAALQAQASGTAQPQTAANGEPVNEVAEAQEKQGWETQDSSVKQHTEKDCGEASLTFVAKASRGGEEKKSEKEERQEVREKAKETRTYEHVRSRTKVNLADGASAEEVGAVLGSMGIGIQKGIGGFDSKELNQSLRQGKMVMAMVDSNAILNPKLRKSQRTDQPGHLHWVTIDGYNRGRTSDPMDDYYRVRDPVHGSYWVKAKDLQGSIDQGREHHGSGGLLVLEKRRGKYNTAEKREQLAQNNLDQAAELGKGSGLGSRRLSLGESS
jgi:hypothetical protein